MNPEEYLNNEDNRHLTQDEWNHIEEGLSDAENGRILSSEEFWNLLKNA